MLFTVIAFLGLFIAVVTTILAVRGTHHYYWLAAIGIYVFSLIAGFSIGQLSVGLTFIPLALAIGYTLHLIKNKLHLTTFVGAGLLVGVLIVVFVDDYWLFYPLSLFN